MRRKSADAGRQDGVFYPDSDGKPMADHETNAERMIDTCSALREGFRRRGEPAHVSRDQLVYPVEGDPKIRNAPDILVAPGCEEHARPSFKCWDEPGRIVFAGEFLSFVKHERYESRSIKKRIDFYRDHLGTEELFIYQPLGMEFSDGFRFFFLRLGPSGAYGEVEPAEDGWYRSQVTPFDFRPVLERLEVRDSRTGELFLPDRLRADRAEERAREAEERAREAEERARRAEERLWRRMD